MKCCGASKATTNHPKLPLNESGEMRPNRIPQNLQLGGGFKDLLFSPLFGEDFQFD